MSKQKKRGQKKQRGKPKEPDEEDKGPAESTQWKDRGAARSSSAKGRAEARRQRDLGKKQRGGAPTGEAQLAGTELDNRLIALGFGTVAEATDTLFGRLSPDYANLERGDVEKGIRMLGEETTRFKGKVIPQIEALEFVQDQGWAPDPEEFYNKFFLKYVTDNIRNSKPEAMYHWFDDLKLGPVAKFQHDLFGEIQADVSAGELTEKMVADGLGMLQTKQDASSVVVKRTQLQALLSEADRMRCDELGRRVAYIVKENIIGKYEISFSRW